MGVRRSPGGVQVQHGAARCGHNCGGMRLSNWLGRRSSARAERLVRASLLPRQLGRRPGDSLPAEVQLAIMSADGQRGPSQGSRV
jgi:hypothetical protein